VPPHSAQSNRPPPRPPTANLRTNSIAHLGHGGDEPLVPRAVGGGPSPGPGPAPLPHVVPAAALAARLRDAVRARAALSAVGALEEAEGGLDPLLLVAEVPAALTEPTASVFALNTSSEVEGDGAGGFVGRKSQENINASIVSRVL